MNADTLRELIQDLRAHAHEAPATSAALMRRAAAELERPYTEELQAKRPMLCRSTVEPHRRVKGVPCR